jgi:hypothetical protein
VDDTGRLDRPDLLESHIRVPEVVEEARTATEQHRNDVQLELVQGTGNSLRQGALDPGFHDVPTRWAGSGEGWG